MKKLPVEFFEKSMHHSKPNYRIEYLLTTDMEMQEWLSDFIERSESRDETIIGTIDPYTDTKEN